MLWVVVFLWKKSYFMYFNQWKRSLVITAFKVFKHSYKAKWHKLRCHTVSGTRLLSLIKNRKQNKWNLSPLPVIEMMTYLLPPEAGLERASNTLCYIVRHLLDVKCSALILFDSMYCIFIALSSTDVSNTGDANFLLFQEQTYYFSRKPDLAITLVANWQKN